MRLVRTIAGVLVLLVALPLLLAGVALWTAQRHRSADGSFVGRLDPVATQGYAVVVSDVDALLRRDAAFARGGQTALRVTGSADRPLFVALGPAEAVARYLDGVPHAALTEVKLTRGALPVRLSTVAGEGTPSSPPLEQAFWFARGISADTVEWVPSAVRGQHLSLVVMNRDGSAGVRATLRAGVAPRWLGSTTWGVLVLGGVLLVLAVVTICWPTRPREIVYVMEPTAPGQTPAEPTVEPAALPVDASTEAAAAEPEVASESASESASPSVEGEPDSTAESGPGPERERVLAGAPPVDLALEWPPAAVPQAK